MVFPPTLSKFLYTWDSVKKKKKKIDDNAQREKKTALSMGRGDLPGFLWG